MVKDGNDYVLSPSDKQSNADSYTLTAGGMELRSLVILCCDACADKSNYSVVFTPVLCGLWQFQDQQKS